MPDARELQQFPMPKWANHLIALVALPVCLGLTGTLFRLLEAGSHQTTIWVPLTAGAACWLVIYLLLPKPMLAYVFGHELTHVLWTWLFGGRVKKFKVSRKGGHVRVTKTNFLIMLSPYFFPLYALIVLGFFLAASRIWDWQTYHVWFHLLLGAAYSFHVTLTWHALKSEQSDITAHGILFSTVIIWLGNVIVLLLSLPTLVRVPYATVLRWMGEDGTEFFRWLWSWLGV